MHQGIQASDAPPAAVAAWILFGHSISDWAAAVAIAYTVFLFVIQLWRLIRRKGKENESD